MPIPTPAPVVPGAVPFGDWSGRIGDLQIGAGTIYKVVGVTGWYALATQSLGGNAQPSAKAFANGSYPLPYYAPDRVVTLLLDIETSPAEMADAAIALATATPPGVMGVPVMLQVGGESTTVYGAVSNRDVPTELAWLAGYAQATVEVTCPDPRRFGSPVSAATALPMSTGGLTWPITWPIEWDSVQVSGQATLSNAGNVSGPLTLRIDGPVTAPIVAHSSGPSLVFASDFTIAAGDFVLIDTEARTVLYNGQASRNGWLVSRGWFGFDPGDNTFSFSAGSYNSSALLTVTATPAWI